MLSCVAIDDPPGSNGRVPIQWSHRQTWLKSIGHQIKPNAMTLGRLQAGRRFARGGRGIGEGRVKQVECTVYMHGMVRVRRWHRVE